MPTSRVLCAAVLAAAAAGCSDDGSPVANRDCTELDQSASAVVQALASGQSQVRVNLVSRLGADLGSGEGISTSGVELYQNNNCFRAGATTLTRLGTVENDMGGMVADAALDVPQITHVALLVDEPQEGGRRVRSQKIALPQPITLEGGTRTEIFLALDSVVGTPDASVRFVAAGPVPLDAGTVMVFEPGRAASAKSRGGFTLDLPANGASRPTVYGILEHPMGGVSSAYTILPEGALGGKARITFPVDRARIPQGMAMADFGARVGGAATQSTVAGNIVSMDVSSLGVTSMGTDRAYVELPDGTRMASPAGGGAAAAVQPGRLITGPANDCYYNLSANRASYLDLLSRNAGVKVSVCENVAPHVHIVLVNIGYTLTTGVRPRVMFPGEWYTGTNEFLLRTLTDLYNQVGAFTAINGFTWDPPPGKTVEQSDGTHFGETGVPKGTFYINGTRKSPAYSGAEAIIGFTSQSGGYTYASLFDKPSGGTVNLGSYNWNAVPSTTSVIKNGVCSQPSSDSNWNRWSAIGIGNGILVMASSLSGEETTAYELCSVFEGLNVMGGAIRLDGGPSAAINWLGTVLNPITGLASYKYGSYRHIAYGIAGVK